MCLRTWSVLKDYHSPMDLRRPKGAVHLLLAVTIALPATARGQAAQSPPTAPQLRAQALDLAYNLDHEQALALLRRAVALAPDDPATHRAIGSVLWLNILFRRGAVTVDHYLGAFS